MKSIFQLAYEAMIAGRKIPDNPLKRNFAAFSYYTLKDGQTFKLANN